MLGQAEKAPVACRSCNRRKIKCDRLSTGCSACSKAEVMCKYLQNSQEVTRRKPRGPYKRRTTHRERELEGLVKAMGEGRTGLENVGITRRSQLQQDSATGTDCSAEREPSTYEATARPFQPPTDAPAAAAMASAANIPSTPNEPQLINTSSHIAEDTGLGTKMSAIVTPTAFTPPLILSSPTWSRSTSLLPQLLDLWQVYRVSVDPVTKLVHCPSFTERIMGVGADVADADCCLRALLYSICYAAASCLSDRDLKARFRKRKEALLYQYERLMEIALGETGSDRRPSLYVLQALVIYLTVVYQHKSTNVAKFNQAVTEAKNLLETDKPGSHRSLSILETQLLHRCWWSLYVIDYHKAAKLDCPPDRCFDPTDHIPLPLNLNDIDLGSTLTMPPIPRTVITEMSYLLLIIELTQLTAEMQYLNSSDPPLAALECSSRAIHRRIRTIETQIILNCETSRHYDWLLLLTARAMLNPIELQFRSLEATSPAVSASLSSASTSDTSERGLALFLDVIECWYILDSNADLSKWSWHTRIFNREFEVEDISARLAKWPESEQRSRAQTLLELGTR